MPIFAYDDHVPSTKAVAPLSSSSMTLFPLGSKKKKYQPRSLSADIKPAKKLASRTPESANIKHAEGVADRPDPEHDDQPEPHVRQTLVHDAPDLPEVEDEGAGQTRAVPRRLQVRPQGRHPEDQQVDVEHAGSAPGAEGGSGGTNARCKGEEKRPEITHC